MFTELNNLMEEGDKVSLTIMKVGESLTVSVMPNNKASVKPMTITATPYELDYHFINTIKQPLELSKTLSSNIEEFEQAAKDEAELKSEAIRMDFDSLCYWIDMGNSQNTGQVILGSFKAISQPKKANVVSKLPNVLEMFPNMAEMEDIDEPSCSMQEALAKQDLMINPMIANVAASMVWKLFQNISIDHVGAYVNSEKLNINQIKL